MSETAVGVVEAPVVVKPPEPAQQPLTPEPSPVIEPVDSPTPIAETETDSATENIEEASALSESEEKASVEDVKELDLTEIPEDLEERPRWTQAFVKRIEKLQPRLGLQEVARIETKETRRTRVRGTIKGLTNDEFFKEQLKDMESSHEKLDPLTRERVLRENITAAILKKAGRGDLKVIQAMLEDPDSYPEIKKIEGNLRSKLPEEMKSRNTRKIKKGLGIIFLATLAELFGESSRGYEAR